ncbi:hypothetical protein C6500_09115 [Candidatus Poribacteria bacterium]|nr:MAG: hypothetical protein C6500_09115 [Candidatus Poribacteria bacterium]
MLNKFRVVLSLLLIFGFSATLFGKERKDAYFAHVPGSYWVYKDQDGNELTRRAVENKEIEGEMYSSFSYEPIWEDWTDYDYHIHPNFYKVGEERVTFLMGDAAQKAIKARLTKEMGTLRTILRLMMEGFDLLYEIEAETEDPFYVLPTSVTSNAAWEAMQINAKITMRSDPPQDPEEMILEITIVETGKVLGTEDVETSAGTFENCLKIEYQTETKVETFPLDQADQVPNPPGESVTTLWVAPNVGIVKFHQKREDTVLKALPPLPHPLFKVSTTIETLELKAYEVKSADSGTE